jgi:cell division protein FtsL
MATAPVLVPELQRPLRPVVPLRGTSGRSQPREVLFEKAIDNSRLYREVDPEKHRQCFTLLGMVGLAFIFVFFFAWEHFRCVRYGYEIEQLKSQRTALTVWNERLHLEQALLADPQRIDRLARADLGLTPPGSQQIVRLDGSRGQSRHSNDPVFARNFESLAPAARGNPREP